MANIDEYGGSLAQIGFPKVTIDPAIEPQTILMKTPTQTLTIHNVGVQEEEFDLDKPQTLAMMAGNAAVMTGTLKAFEEARERIAELERQLEVKNQRINRLETEAFWNADSRDSWHQKAIEVKAERNTARQQRDTLLETVASQAAEIERQNIEIRIASGEEFVPASAFDMLNNEAGRLTNPVFGSEEGEGRG